MRRSNVGPDALHLGVAARVRIVTPTLRRAVVRPSHPERTMCLMCPVCLTSIAITGATTPEAGGAVTALVLQVKRSLSRDQATETEPQPEHRDGVDAPRPA